MKTLLANIGFVLMIILTPINYIMLYGYRFWALGIIRLTNFVAINWSRGLHWELGQLTKQIETAKLVKTETTKLVVLKDDTSNETH